MPPIDPDDLPSPHAGHRSLGDLFRALSADAAALVRQEAQLLRAELNANLSALARHALGIALGGAVLGVGALVLVAAAVAFLGDALDGRYALAALIVGLVLALAGGALVLASLRRMRDDSVAPERSLASVRTTGAWAKAEAADVRAALAGRTPSTSTRDAERAGVPPGRVAAGALPAAGATGAAAEAGSTASTASADGDHPLARGPFWKRVFREFGEDEGTGQAAKVAYYTFMALPPTLLVLFALTGFFGGSEVADWLTANLRGMLPAEASRLIEEFVTQVVHENAPGPFSVGLLIALWSSSNIFLAFGDALNRAYDLEDRRSWLKKRLVAVGVLLATLLLMLGGSAALLAGPQIARAVGLAGAAETAWAILQWPLAFALVVGAFWIILYVLPDRDQSGFEATLLKGAAVSAALWLLATAGFRFYVSNFGSYGETYGFLGAVIVLLLWLYVTGIVVVLGGEVASELERRRVRA